MLAPTAAMPCGWHSWRPIVGLDWFPADASASIAAVFYAREIEGESAQTVSRRFAISEANVWIRVHRARKAMQTFLTAVGLNERSGLTTGSRKLSQAALEAAA